MEYGRKGGEGMVWYKRAYLICDQVLNDNQLPLVSERQLTIVQQMKGS